MTYSYQKQIERLLEFVEDVYKSGRLKGNEWFENQARSLLMDEPVRATTYGILETPQKRKDEGLNPQRGCQ